MRSIRGAWSRARAFSSLAIAAGALIAVTAVPAAAQVDTASAVNGAIRDCLVIVVGTDDTGPGASATTTDQVWKCQGEADDERLNGDIDLVYNIAGWSGTGAIQWGYARISNDQGTWNGTWSSNIQEGGEQLILGWYEGTGAYEGWSYVETQHGQYQQPRETFGIVYPGPLPPTVVIAPFPVAATEAAE